MNDYVLAVDAAKRKSTAGLFGRPPALGGAQAEPNKKRRKNYDGSEPVALIKPHDVPHTREALDRLLDEIRGAGVDPVGLSFIVESTAVYHRPITNYLESKGLVPIVINPLYGSQTRGDSLRKTKTDSADAKKLASIYFTGSYKNSRHVTAEQRDAQRINRRIEAIEEFVTTEKARLKMALCESFCELPLKLKNGDIKSTPVIRLIYKYPTAEAMSKASLKSVSSALSSCGMGDEEAEAKAKEIKQLASESICLASDFGEGFCAMVRSLVDNIERLEKEKEELKKTLISICENRDLFNVLSSFKGIGPASAARATAELWDLSDFSTPQALISFVGVDPGVKQSGDSVDSNGAISKRGNRHLRRIFFVIMLHFAMIGARKDANEKNLVDQTIYDYYVKKKNEGQKPTSAKNAAICKLLRKIFYRFKEFKETGEITVA